MAEWERLCIGIFVEKKTLMFPRNGSNTNLYLVQKNESFKIPTDFNNQTDNITEHGRQDMIIVNKTNKKAQ